MRRLAFAAALIAILTACSPREKQARPGAETAPRPSILLVTLDTTRFDAIGNGTPAFNALASRGAVFTQAYATAPQTLPSHASMLTGLYPGGHGVHENGRPLASQHALVAERLQSAGYRTAAFVSSFSLARRYGVARGFETYDDASDRDRSERSARNTTDRAIAWLQSASAQPTFLWVHYFDPHHPYEPSYAAEVATMDEQLGRLTAAFERIDGAKAYVIVADHGEGLGDHGEAQHGNLLYQSVMHVPLAIAGPGVRPGKVDAPVSTRRVFHTLLDWAGLGSELSLRSASSEVVVGEAMMPFLQYGWQPQVMAVEGRQKVIHAGRIEAYDVVADPAETRDLGRAADLSRGVRQTLRDYPIPTLAAAAPANVSDEERRRLASLGYVASEAKPVVRKDAPRPRDMAHIFDELEQASGLFVREQYAAVIPLCEKILAADPHNVSAALRLGIAHSSLGHDAEALAAFRRAEAIAPTSPDVRQYLALHLARTNDWQRAVPELEQINAESPDRLPVLEALAMLYERQRRPDKALPIRQRIATLKPLSAAEHARIGELAMELGQTAAAVDAFEKARAAGAKVDLQLGVLYLASRRYAEARDALDRAGDDPMALFKRAQVSVLLAEPDRATRIARARQHADATTRELIARERLFASQ